MKKTKGKGKKKKHTFAFLPYFVVMLRNGTIVIVNTVPHRMPPIIPMMCCCHGNVPIANIHIAKNINFIKAKWGRFNCFQCIINNNTAIDETTPAIEANGPTYFPKKIKNKQEININILISPKQKQKIDKTFSVVFILSKRKNS